MNNPVSPASPASPASQPVPQRGSARWRAVIMPNGQPVRKGPIRQTRAEAEQDIDRVRKKISGIIWVERVEPE